MLTERKRQQISYPVLCATPFIAFGVAAIRPLRIPGVYHVVGGVLFATVATAAWMLGARAIRATLQNRRQLALAGSLLAAPFAIVALLWVGIGAPPVATPAENEMRYLVLVLMAMSVVAGFVVLKESLREAGEHCYSMLGFSAILLAGSLYLIWDAFVYGVYIGQEHGGEAPNAIVSLHAFQGLLLSIAGALTYVSTAAFAVSLARTGWLARKASRAYIIVSLVALLLIVTKIQQRLDPAAASGPWYALPGLILGVPAVPLIMPALLGVLLLRRAGDEQYWGAA